MDLNDLIRLDDVCVEYFGVTPRIAVGRAAKGTLPVPAFRLSGTRRGPLFIRKSDLTKYIEDRAREATLLFDAEQPG